MNFKTLTITIVIAASLAALASMPLTAIPAEAGGNVKADQKTHVHHNDVGGDLNTDQNQECVGIDITGSCTSTVNNPPGPTKCLNPAGNEVPCPKPK
jgi:hypothetical protein